MELFEKNGNCIYILNVLKKYTDYEHMLNIAEIRKNMKMNDTILGFLTDEDNIQDLYNKDMQ